MEQLSDSDPAREELLQALVQAMRWNSLQASLLRQAMAAGLRLSPTDLECLGVVQQRGALTAGQLAEVVGLTTGAVTGVIDRMAAAGYAARETDPNDRRRVIVRPAAEGLAELEAMDAGFQQSVGRALASYSAADLQLLLDFHRRAALAMQQEVARLRSAQRPASGEQTSAPLGAASAGRLEFTNGISRVTIRAGSDPQALYSAAFEGAQPAVRVQDGTVSFHYRSFNLFDWSRHEGQVALNPALPWSIAVSGGAARVTIDASLLTLAELSVEGGVGGAEILLPEPHGMVPVRLAGGLSKATIRHPEGSQVELQLSGGASRLHFEGRRFGAVGGDLRLASSGWESASDRYDIHVTGGASRLVVDTFQPDQPVGWPN